MNPILKNDSANRNSASLHKWYVDILLNREPHWPFEKRSNENLENEALQLGRKNGILTLCTHLLVGSPAWATIPQSFQIVLKNNLRQETLINMSRQAELKKVLEGLARENIVPILLKGTPLAFRHYPTQHLRVRCDTDMLFQDRQTAIKAFKFMQQQGYAQVPTVSGDLISYQFACYKKDSLGIIHVFDCHWAISNNQYFARLFPYDELLQQTIDVPEISDHASGLNDIYSLIIACTHLVTHIYKGEAERLIWFYDIHLLCRLFSADHWQQFLTLATQKKICSICLNGLQQTMDTLQTSVPSEILAQLAIRKKNETFTERMGISRTRIVLSDFRALPSWRQRLHLFREYCFPDSSYMQTKYNITNKSFLPLLYVYRLTQGLYKLIRSKGKKDRQLL